MFRDQAEESHHLPQLFCRTRLRPCHPPFSPRCPPPPRCLIPRLELWPRKHHAGDCKPGLERSASALLPRPSPRPIPAAPPLAPPHPWSTAPPRPLQPRPSLRRAPLTPGSPGSEAPHTRRVDPGDSSSSSGTPPHTRRRK